MTDATHSGEHVYTRKEFFRLGFLKMGSALATVVEEVGSAVASRTPSASGVASASPAGTAAAGVDFVRPPGALRPDRDFLEACTSCDECVKACPHWVLKKAGPELGAQVTGTPMLVPSENPCLMCDGFPCIAACPEGALVMPIDGATPRIGTAVVDGSACYMGMGQPCDYCMNDCPTAPKSIVLTTPGTLPVVDPESCTGCGKCAQICPPRAIRIVELVS